MIKFIAIIQQKCTELELEPFQVTSKIGEEQNSENKFEQPSVE